MADLYSTPSSADKFTKSLWVPRVGHWNRNVDNSLFKPLRPCLETIVEGKLSVGDNCRRDSEVWIERLNIPINTLYKVSDMPAPELIPQLCLAVHKRIQI